MSTKPTQDAIVIGAPTKAFPQSGSWNMGDLTVNSTIGVLARYSAGRVNPYTAVVGETICRMFPLSMVGRRNIDSAISNLKVVGSLGNTLAFGFGIEDVIRSIGASEEGRVCLALCAALKDCYSDAVAIEVLLELARLHKVDGQYMPSTQSWRDLLNACSGTLSTTQFPAKAEYLMRLPNPKHRLGAYSGLDADLSSSRGCSSPKSIAEALSALSRIMNNDLQAVTFVGGADVGWLAAVAEWMFDLKVSMTSSNGELFYAKDHSQPDMVQVHVIFREDEGEVPQSIQQVGKTYYLDDVSKIFSDEGHPPSDSVVSGRLPWKEVLSSTFQQEFKALLDLPTSFAQLLGSAAKIFQALARADKSFKGTYLRACTSYCDASIGPGFITNILQWFPELNKLKANMQKAAKVKLSEAKRTYELCINQIRTQCNCSTCKSSSTGFGFAKADDDQRERSDEQMSNEGSEDIDWEENGTESETELDWDPDTYCQVVIAETIITLSRALSNVTLESKDLLPMRSGLELAYGRQLTQRRSALSGRTAVEDLGPIAFCMDFDNNFSFGMQDGNEEAVEIRLHAVLELFAGKRAPSTNRHVSAICVNGICAFLGVLREPSVDRNDVARVHIIPGRIYHERKRYDQLVDKAILGDDHGDFAHTQRLMACVHGYDSGKLQVRESSTSLECLMIWDLDATAGDPDAILALQKFQKIPQLLTGPSQLAVTLGSRRGLIPCKSTTQPQGSSRMVDCQVGRAPIPIGQDIDLSQLFNSNSAFNFVINDKTIYVFRCAGSKDVTIALASTAKMAPECEVYIADKECLHCSVRQVLSIDRPERTQFCILYLP